MESLCNIVQVMSVQTSNRDSSISCHVDVVIVLQGVYLIGRQTSVSEHANLGGDMRPIVSTAMSSELINKSRSHFLHSGRHVDQILMPACSELRV